MPCNPLHPNREPGSDDHRSFHKWCKVFPNAMQDSDGSLLFYGGWQDKEWGRYRWKQEKILSFWCEIQVFWRQAPLTNANASFHFFLLCQIWHHHIRIRQNNEKGHVKCLSRETVWQHNIHVAMIEIGPIFLYSCVARRIASRIGFQLPSGPMWGLLLTYAGTLRSHHTRLTISQPKC